MLSLHTNAAALSTQNALGANNKSLTSSMTKLGTGFRINSAMDDAAGLQIANRLRAQNSGMAVAMRNTQNGISLMQTAEGALNEVNTMLVRMKDLATQSADASASAADKEAMQAEYDSLASEITNIIGNTTFGGEKLMNKTPTTAETTAAKTVYDDLVAEVGIEPTLTATTPYTPNTGGSGLGQELADLKALTKVAQDTYTADTAVGSTKTTEERATSLKALSDAQKAEREKQKEFDTKSVATKNAKDFHAALDAAEKADAPSGKLGAEMMFQIGSTTAESMSLNLTAQMNALHKGMTGISSKYTSFGASASGNGKELTDAASVTIDKLQNVLDTVGEMRSALGAASNRLEHTNSNLANMSSTTSAAIGRIMDVDYATETSNMTKNQMLMQASSAMLKQSNSMSQMVASLLQ